MPNNVLDYSGWRPNPKDLAAAGVIGVCRYTATQLSNGRPVITWKAVTPNEYQAILAAGLSFTPNAEESTTSYLGGYATGKRIGVAAREQMRQLGHPDSGPIILSIDTSITPTDLAVALDHLHGFNDGGGCGPQRVYGTGYLIDQAVAAGLATGGWQTNARAWYGNRADSPNAQILQRSSKSYPQFPAAQYDENTPVADYWGQYPPPTGQAEDTDMTPAQDKILNTILQKVLTLPDDTWHHLLPPLEQYGADTAESRTNYTAVKTANTVLPALADLEAKVDRLTAIVAALTVPGGDVQVLHDVVREELDSTTWQSKPNT